MKQPFLGFVVHLTLFLVPMLYKGSAVGQEVESSNSIDLSMNVDLTSQYLWRGLVLSNGPAIQPGVEMSLNKFSVGAWGSAAFQAHDSKEVDLYLAYTLSAFKLTVLDYYYYADTVIADYFNYKKDQSSHVIEGVIEFTGTEKIPFRLLAGLNLFNDRNNSAYFELAWLTAVGATNVEVLAGYTPQVGYYHPDRKGFTNVGINMNREYAINQELTMPLRLSLTYSPLIRQTHLVLIIGLY
ncbi:MAG: hypothetical protein KKD74_14185 [Bacteroidetes bacterium]|nr:hypothetical protein [Bacteroidota bacterium]